MREGNNPAKTLQGALMNFSFAAAFASCSCRGNGEKHKLKAQPTATRDVEALSQKWHMKEHRGKSIFRDAYKRMHAQAEA